MSADAFGVYVHWPFCLAKCPYCDFNSHVRHGGIDQGDFVTAYLAELEHFAALAPGRIVSSIFFGGGTPSLMAPETVGAILDRIAALWPIETGRGDHARSQSDIRRGWTVRRLPCRRRQPRVRSACSRSTMRASKSLGRKHTSEEALAALAIAKRNFERVSFDLIYARQGQALPAWREELASALTPRARPSLALSAHHRGGHAVRGASRRGGADSARGRKGRGLLSPHPGTMRRRRPPLLRSVEPCAAWSRVAAQSALLARPRLCRRRPRRP